jgi:hypothetical protein
MDKRQVENVAVKQWLAGEQVCDAMIGVLSKRQ